MTYEDKASCGSSPPCISLKRCVTEFSVDSWQVHVNSLCAEHEFFGLDFFQKNIHDWMIADKYISTCCVLNMNFSNLVFFFFKSFVIEFSADSWQSAYQVHINQFSVCSVWIFLFGILFLKSFVTECSADSWRVYFNFLCVENVFLLFSKSFESYCAGIRSRPTCPSSVLYI